MSDTFIFTEGFDSFSMDSNTPVFYGGTNITVFPETIAPVYSPNETYSVGNLRMHEGLLYECNTEISTAEAWNPSHWTGVPVTSMVTDNSDAIEALSESVDEKEAAILQKMQEDMIDQYGNMLLDFADFPTSGGVGGNITLTWSDDKTSCEISYPQKSYDVLIGLYDPYPSVLPEICERGATYPIWFSTDTDRIQLTIAMGGTETDYTSDTEITIPQSGSFELYLTIKAGTSGTGNINYLCMAYALSNMQVSKRALDKADTITTAQIDALF